MVGTLVLYRKSKNRWRVRLEGSIGEDVLVLSFRPRNLHLLPDHLQPTVVDTDPVVVPSVAALNDVTVSDDLPNDRVCDGDSSDDDSSAVASECTRVLFDGVPDLLQAVEDSSDDESSSGDISAPPQGAHVLFDSIPDLVQRNEER